MTTCRTCLHWAPNNEAGDPTQHTTAVCGRWRRTTSACDTCERPLPRYGFQRPDKLSTPDQFQADMSAMNVPRAPLATLLDGPPGSAVILPICKPCEDELICPACGQTYFRGLQHAGWRQRPDGSEYAVVGCCQSCVDAQPPASTTITER